MNYTDLQAIFAHLNTLCWDSAVPDAVIFDIAVKNFAKFTQGKTKHRQLVRLAGQSGSGKTTQLLPSVEKYCAAKQIKPFQLAVRQFAALHPDYQAIVEQFGQSQMREKTNLFALKCLLVTLILAINEDYDILLEMTLLTPEFEAFVNQYLTKHHYQTLCLVLAVNQEISNFLINKRQNMAGSEAGRVVYPASREFFYTVLPTAIAYYSQKHPQARVIIWDAWSRLPVYDGTFQNASQPFAAAREKITYDFADENAMREAKINYLLNLS